VVRYGSAPAQARVVRGAGGGVWRRVEIRVPGAAYRGRLARGADIAVSALRGSSATLHMVEVAVPGR
jgi:hypothetical protein